jgi:PAS domain S-box-containing protein
LGASEKRLSAIFAQAAVGLAEISLEGRFLRVNDELCHILGYSCEQLCKMAVVDVTYPEDIAAGFERLREVLATGKPASLDKRYLRPDGTFIYANSTLTPLLGDGDQPSSILVVTVDLTARKFAEEKLRESEERFRLLVEGTSDYAMFLMDNDRKIVHWNSGAERVFGWTREEIIGKSADMIFTPEDIAAGAPEAESQIALKDGRALDRRWHIRKDGSRFWADGVMSCLRDGSTLRGFAKIARDTTRQKETEEELRKAHDEMEQRVVDRTLELGQANAALRKHAATMERAEAERQLLLQRLVMAQEDERKRISRELHDQMGQTLTALKIGLTTEPDDKKDSESRTKTLSTLLDDLVKQVHNLAWELRPAALDNFGLETALEQYIANWSEQAQIKADFVGRGFTRSRRLAPHIETAFYRVVQEALTNVQRHAKATTVSVMLERVGDEVLAIVEDNGKGMPSKTRRQKTAQTADETPTSNRLGIVGMRERMELIGGSLTVESRSGKGTTVFARAPFDTGSTPSA